jgi:hypothetical protein
MGRAWYRSAPEVSMKKKQLGRLKCRREDNIKVILKESDLRMLTGFIWLWVRTNGRVLRTR